MKKFSILIIALLMPMLATAQKYPTGITPYTFNTAWGYFLEYNQEGFSRAEKVLKKMGYSYVGSYTKMQTESWINHVFTRDCTVTIDADGFVKTAKATNGNKYASYIEVGPGEGMDWNMRVTFLTSTGSSYFVKLLKKSKYRFQRENSVWLQSSTRNNLFQNGKSFSVSDVVGYEDFAD